MASNRIKELREKKELTQKQLAKFMGVSASLISRWETGTAQPSPEQWEELRELFRLDSIMDMASK